MIDIIKQIRHNILNNKFMENIIWQSLKGQSLSVFNVKEILRFHQRGHKVQNIVVQDANINIGKAKSKHEERICAYCGESFEIKRTATNICCSWKCRIARQRTPDWPTRTKELKECQQCGKEFWVRQNRLKIGEGKFCSKKCLSKSQQIFNATAPEFYNMAEWREIRIKVLERDDNRCKTCGFNGKGLHVHHIEYKRNGGNEDMNNLITICNQSHMRIHGQNKNKGRDIQLMLSRMYV